MYKTVTEFSCFIKVQKVYVFPFKALEQTATITTTEKCCGIFMCFDLLYLFYILFFFIQTSFHLYHKIPHML